MGGASRNRGVRDVESDKASAKSSGDPSSSNRGSTPKSIKALDGNRDPSPKKSAANNRALAIDPRKLDVGATFWALIHGVSLPRFASISSD